MFTPRKEVESEENLRAFVDLCRNQLTAFGKELSFDELAWDVTEAVNLKGHGRKRVRIYFSTQATADSNTPAPMKEPFLSFAKAYVRYMQGLRPTKNPAFRVTATRAIESALLEHGHADPVRIDATVLNRAAALLSRNLAETTAYRVGSQLELIASFMVGHGISSTHFQWRCPIKRPSDTVRVGKEFDKRRQEKMPSKAALDALPKAFHLATSFVDTLFSSVAAILCSAPDRINEALLLSDDCEVSDLANDGTPAYGLRWQPAKGGEPMIKWIVPSMAQVVSHAIERIRILTVPARTIAQWYENNPTTLYFAKEVRHLANEDVLTLEEAVDVLWTSGSVAATREWCVRNGVPIQEGRVQRKDLEFAVLRLLPEGFPNLSRETGLRYSQALLITRRNETHSERATYRCLVDPVTINQVNTALGARSELGFESIFDRLGFSEEDGTPIRVSTHQFRHYLNTLAQAGGMTQLDIAKWSGRINVQQNNAYNHVTAEQMIAKIRSSIGDPGAMFGPLAELPKNMPINRDEFARLKILTAHTTDFGCCVHDYTMSPCELHADCINCNEHVCIKGDEAKTIFTRKRLEEAKLLLLRAEEAKERGYHGADRWIDHHRMTVRRLEQLCHILDDPEVPAGSVVQLSNVPTVSRISQAIEDRKDSVIHLKGKARVVMNSILLKGAK
ncbi:MAG: integrase [Planctomycetota bacterium]